MADVDGDGDLDIYVCNYDSPNELFINQGVDGSGIVQFVDEARAFGVDIVDASHVPAFCDYDRDGDLDLYVLTNRYEDPNGYRGNEAYTMVNGRPTLKPDYEKYYLLWYRDAENWGVRAYGRRDYLFRNEGANGFIDVAKEAGITGRGDGLSATWWDSNNDGLMDLYVGNDFISPDHLYLNQGDGTFRDVIHERMPHSSWFSMGADFGDLNNDGYSDFLIADMSATNHFKQKTTMGVMGGPILKAANESRPPQYMRNALSLGTGTGRFFEAAFLTGLDSTDWTWAVKIADFDNDGWQDVFVTNGTVRAMNDSDYTLTTEQLKDKHEWEYLREMPPRVEENRALRNPATSLEFENVSHEWGLAEMGISYGAAYSDLDRDGDLDLLVMNAEKPVSLFRNDSEEGNRVVLKLDGVNNRHGIGARVSLTAGTLTQQRQLVPTSGYLSANEPVLHFGLGREEVIRRLEVQWPSGSIQRFDDLESNHYYTVTEPADDGQPAIRHEPEASPKSLFAKGAVPLRRHRENEFDDFSLQPLLPNRLSQLGAGISIGDVDSDGDDDIFLGGGAGQIAELRINKGRGRYSAEWVEAFRDDKAHEDMGSVFFDADGDGDLDLYVVSGSYEFPKGDPRLQDRLYLNDGSGGFSRAPEGMVPEFLVSGSAVAAADYDRDGDVDLFVGGRLVPGEYPVPPRSVLLRNDGNKFTDAADDVKGLANTGLVTGCLWSDATGDGWLDLLVTHEWGPVKLYTNREGVMVDETDAAQLGERTGWWNSIAGGDIDGDGDIDYAVGNQGLNSKYHASVDKPVQVFYGDYNGDGKKNLVEAEFENDVLYPIRGKSCSTNAMPHLGEKFTSFRAFAAASLPEIYSDQGLETALKLQATTLSSGVLTNNGDGTFGWRELPEIAQISPIYGMAFTDADSDGFTDLYVVQNFFSPQAETGRFDGGMSLLLSGDGDGGLRPVWPRESGLVVSGDASALVVTDLNDDLRPDYIVGINDGAPETFLNQGVNENRPVAVRLSGSGIGAKVTLELLSGESQTAEVHCGSGYQSQSGGTLFFGVPKGSEIDSIAVVWPDGSESVHSSIEVSSNAPVVLTKP